jgi:hypothetical protein
MYNINLQRETEEKARQPKVKPHTGQETGLNNLSRGPGETAHCTMYTWAVQAGGPDLSRAAFISGALRELSVALCRGNASLCRSGANVATRAAGRAPMRGLARPSAEVVWACLAPCVWVWGFWFGFALRCVALLCGVFVRLHSALFPAGGPFLPSLSVKIHNI